MRQIINVGTTDNDGTGDPIRTAFTKTNANFAALYGRSYGAFQSTETQTCNTKVATPFTFNHTDVVDGVTITNSSTINLPNAGVYDIQFSVQTKNTSNTNKTLYLWLRQNDVDIVGSSGKIVVPGTQAGGSGEQIIGWNFFITAASAGQTVQIMWFVDDEQSVTISTFPAQSATASSPAIPSTASIVLTVNQIY